MILSLRRYSKGSGFSLICCNIKAPSLRFLKWCCLPRDENEGSGLFNFFFLECPLPHHAHDESWEPHQEWFIQMWPPYSPTHASSSQSVVRELFVYSHLDLITTLHEIKHQYSPDSTPTVRSPSSTRQGRIPAFRILEKVLFRFPSTRQTNIVPEADTISFAHRQQECRSWNLSEI